MSRKPPRKPPSLVAAVERDLARLPADLAESALATLALALAADVDGGGWARAPELRQTLKELRALAPPEETKDGIDELAEQRDKRRAGVAKTADQPGS